MIDVHCHILPDFDDGASDLAESMAMARMAVSSGVTGIVVTPHFAGEAASLRRLPLLIERYDQFRSALQQANIPLQLYLGSEILCLPETPQLAARHTLPPIGNTSYLLTEFYFNESARYMNDMLVSLVAAGYKPVVAHPERYHAVQQDIHLMQFWFEQGYVLQLNKGSLLGVFGPRVQTAAERAISMGLAHLIASDAHSATHRTPHMGALKQWATSQCEPEYARILLERNPARLVSGRPMVPVP